MSKQCDLFFFFKKKKTDSSGSSDDGALLVVEDQSIYLNELEYPSESMMRKEMMSASVSPSLQVHLR